MKFEDQNVLRAMIRHFWKHPSIIDDFTEEREEFWKFIVKAHHNKESKITMEVKK